MPADCDGDFVQSVQREAPDGPSDAWYDTRRPDQAKGS